MELYDLPMDVGAQILKGTDVAGMGTYMENVSRVRQATEYLENLGFEASEAVVRELKELEAQGLHRLSSLFRVLLQSHSAPFDIRPFLNSAIPKLPTALVQNLSRISGYLYVGPVDFGKHVQSYVQVRAPYTVRCIQPLAVPQPPRNDTYTKGSSPLIAWTRALGILIKAEHELADSVLPDPHNVTAFQQSILGITQQYTDAIDTVLQRINRNAALRNYREFWLALDVLHALDQTLGNLTQPILADSGSAGNDLQDLLKQLKSASMGILTQWLAELWDGTTFPNSVDGSVHEVTTLTVANLQRLSEYPESVDALLATMGCVPPLSVGGPAAKGGRLGKFSVDCLDAVLAQLDAKSRVLKPGLNSVFLLNNAHHLLKQLRLAPQLTHAIQAYQFEAKLDAVLKRSIQEYEAVWKPILDPLRDDPSRQAEAAVTLQPPLSKSLREAVKIRIGVFNRGCDERIQTQRAWIIPDVELKAQVVRNVKQMVVPLYQTFYDRYTRLEFTKNPDKHVKFTPASLDAALNQLFSQ